jgi:hypothetical protein
VAAPLTSDSPHLCRSTVAITDAISTDLLIAPTDQWGCMVPGDLDHRTDDLEHRPRELQHRAQLLLDQLAATPHPQTN